MFKRLEYKDEKSNKFWEVNQRKETLTICYGKIGTDGSSNTKSFETEEKAEAFMNKKVKEKLKKGYIEVSGSALGNNKTTQATETTTKAESSGTTDLSNEHIERWLKDWKSIEKEHLDISLLPTLDALENSKLSKAKRVSLAHIVRELFKHLAKEKQQLWDEKI